MANLLCAVNDDPVELTMKQPVVYVRDKKLVEKQLMATVSSTLLRSL